MKKLISLLVSISFIGGAHYSYAESFGSQAINSSSKKEKKEPKNCGDLDESPVWTDWSEKAFTDAISELTEMRESLHENNLFDSYENLPTTLNGKEVVCDQRSQTARIENGTCNDLKYPTMGAKGIAFGHNIPLNKIVKNGNENLMDPSPVRIANELLNREEFKPVSFLNLLAASWLQFMNHDWFFHGKNKAQNPHKIQIGNNTQNFPQTRTDEALSQKRNSQIPKDKIYGNAVTHWWDGSQVYGSDVQTLQTVRTYKDGKMLVQENGILPVGADGIEKVGFKDNWWVGLSMLHNLFVLEHNAIAKMLKETYPNWNDQELYDKARLINAAVMAKIHTVEWTPAILPNNTLKMGMYANWYGGLNPESISVLSNMIENEEGIFKCKDSSKGFFDKAKLKALQAVLSVSNIFNEKASWDLPNFLKHPILTGMIGGNQELFKVPYTITEEFVSVYRMHPLLPESLKIYDIHKGQTNSVVPLKETTHDKSPRLVRTYGLNNLFYSFGQAHPGALTLKNYPNFLRNITVPENPSNSQVIDMAVMDILRDRERGVPRYNEFRRNIGLSPIEKFEDLFVEPNRPDTLENLKDPENQKLLASLKSIYKNDVEQMDLLVGTLGETIRPKNYGFGETAFQIFILMATRRLQADRFYTDDFRSEVYTQEGINWVDKVTMKKVILRHFPELTPAMEDVENAFNPWKEIKQVN